MSQYNYQFASPFEIRYVVDGHIANLQGKGIGGNLIRDQPKQLRPPEVTTWTGKHQQLALLVSGLDVWMELRDFLPQGRVPVKSERERLGFEALVVQFAVRDGES